MDGARLDREARLRAKVRQLLADLRSYGIPDSMLRNKTIIELEEMRDQALCDLMRPPKAAA